MKYVFFEIITGFEVVEQIDFGFWILDCGFVVSLCSIIFYSKSKTWTSESGSILK
jgi:hypothetical protein